MASREDSRQRNPGNSNGESNKRAKLDSTSNQHTQEQEIPNSKQEINKRAKCEPTPGAPPPEDDVQAIQQFKTQLDESTSPNHKKHDQIIDAVVRLIVTANLSHSLGQDLSFIKMCNALNPDFRVSIRKREVIRRIRKGYEKGKEKLIQFFRSFEGRVSLCVECWRHCSDRYSVISIDCRWIDKDWSIQKRIIGFRSGNREYDAKEICELIKDVVEEYGLGSKIFSVSFDNSIKSVEETCKLSLGCKYFYVRNVNRAINLCVKEAIDRFNKYVSPIREATECLRANSSVNKEWRKFCRQNDAKPINLPCETPTSWDTYYKMLSSSCPYAKLLSSFIPTYLTDLVLSDHNWDVCKKIVDVLRRFYDGVLLLNGVYYPTSHLLVYQAIEMVEALDVNENDSILCNVVILMKAKWINYFEDFPDICLIAVVLDPRSKLDGLRGLLVAYYGLLGYNKNDDSKMTGSEKFKDIEAIVNSVRSQIDELFNEYSVSYSQQIPPVDQESLTITQRIMSKIMRMQSSRVYSELEYYLTTEFVFSGQDTGMEFPVLKWWKEHENKFPILNLIAKDVYACAISTMNVNEAFFNGPNVLDRRCSTMLPDLLEAQTCWVDWIKAEGRRQETVLSDDEDFVESD